MNWLKKIFLKTPNFALENEMERDEWVIKSLKKIPDGCSILDAGAGEQKYRKYCSHLNYTSQDFGQYDGKGDGVGLQTSKWNYSKLDITCDITSIPRPDESFAAILCTEVFEHIVNPIDVVKEFSRLLKKDGYLLVTAPFCSLTHFAPYHFYSGYNRYFYENILSKYGFKIIELIPNGDYYKYLGQEILRLPSISQKYNSQKINKLGMLACLFTAKMLGKLSKQKNNSAELLCFGYHVYARKI